MEAAARATSARAPRRARAAFAAHSFQAARRPRWRTAAAALRISDTFAARAVAIAAHALNPKRRPRLRTAAPARPSNESAAARSVAVAAHLLYAAFSSRLRKPEPARRIIARWSTIANQLLRPRRIARAAGDTRPLSSPRRHASSSAFSTHVFIAVRKPWSAKEAAARPISQRAAARSAAASTHAFIASCNPRIANAATPRRRASRPATTAAQVLSARRIARASGVTLRSSARWRARSAADSTHALKPKRSPRFAIATAA